MVPGPQTLTSACSRSLRLLALGLRGPLPCRPGSGTLPVQRISLGLSASEAGLEQAIQALRQVLRELEKAMPTDVMVSTDIGNINSVANSYLRFERPRSFFAAMRAR